MTAILYLGKGLGTKAPPEVKAKMSYVIAPTSTSWAHMYREDAQFETLCGYDNTAKWVWVLQAWARKPRFGTCPNCRWAANNVLLKRTNPTKKSGCYMPGISGRRYQLFEYNWK